MHSLMSNNSANCDDLSPLRLYSPANTHDTVNTMMVKLLQLPDQYTLVGSTPQHHEAIHQTLFLN